MSSLLGRRDLAFLSHCLCGGWAVVGGCNLQQQFTKMFNSFFRASQAQLRLPLPN